MKQKTNIKNLTQELYDKLLTSDNLSWILNTKNKYKNVELEIISDTLIWIDGIWNNGTWKNGYWIDGTWERVLGKMDTGKMEFGKLVFGYVDIGKMELGKKKFGDLV